MKFTILTIVILVGAATAANNLRTRTSHRHDGGGMATTTALLQDGSTSTSASEFFGGVKHETHKGLTKVKKGMMTVSGGLHKAEDETKKGVDTAVDATVGAAAGAAAGVAVDYGRKGAKVVENYGIDVYTKRNGIHTCTVSTLDHPDGGCPTHKKNGGCSTANTHHLAWRARCPVSCGVCLP